MSRLILLQVGALKYFNPWQDLLQALKQKEQQAWEGNRGTEQTLTRCDDSWGCPYGWNKPFAALMSLWLERAVCKVSNPCKLIPTGALEGKQDLPLRCTPASVCFAASNAIKVQLPAFSMCPRPPCRAGAAGEA